MAGCDVFRLLLLIVSEQRPAEKRSLLVKRSDWNFDLTEADKRFIEHARGRGRSRRGWRRRRPEKLPFGLGESAFLLWVMVLLAVAWCVTVVVILLK